MLDILVFDFSTITMNEVRLSKSNLIVSESKRSQSAFPIYSFYNYVFICVHFADVKHRPTGNFIISSLFLHCSVCVCVYVYFFNEHFSKKNFSIFSFCLLCVVSIPCKRFSPIAPSPTSTRNKLPNYNRIVLIIHFWGKIIIRSKMRKTIPRKLYHDMHTNKCRSNRIV